MTENCEYAIQVQDVSKIYRLYEKPIDRLKESLSLTHKSYHRDFFALSNISFQVKREKPWALSEPMDPENLQS